MSSRFPAIGSRSWSHSVGAESQFAPTLSSHIPFQQPPSSAVSHRNRAAFDETYDVNDPTTLTTPPPQRQQQAASRVLPDSTQDPSLRPSSALGSPRSLRRTARLSQRPPSVYVSGRPSQVEQTIPVVVRPVSEHQSGLAALRPALSEAQTEEDDEEADSEEESSRRPGESYWPHRTTSVSPRTASAILWTLEEALRKPIPFTLDWEEVNAPMSDVAGASGPSGFGANGRTQNGSTRATQGPVPVNPHPASGVRTPTDIMRQRPVKLMLLALPVRELRSEGRKSQSGLPQLRNDQSPKPLRLSLELVAAPQSSAGWSKQQTQAASDQPSSQAQQQFRRIPFPHAFERWETLSSHWEGLTGYWIRKLEQNNEALERDPLNQQMARQVTDLSAAGANLFHAVVELQRLRASSERKFQRWFFDTRAEQERSKELLAELERQVRTERQARSEALTSLQKSESDKLRAEELLKEMRRELQISKDEARRAWEELGRREQEERDRTTSLRNGEPTLVGGVQVVPMIPGPASRHNTNLPPTRESPYASGESAARTTAVTEGQYYADTPASPTGTDPFVEGHRPIQEPPSSTSPEAQRQYPGHFYEQSAAYPPRPTSENDDRSYGPSVASSEQGEEDVGSSYRRNPQGQSTAYQPAMSEGSDEYEHGSVEEGGYPPSSMPTTSGPLYGGYTQSVDYSGSGWGVGTGWESVTPRHRHPTRLSDVIEEEEPRTTPSRASLASRSVQ
ncbi:Fungal Zn(2)-Cys(6) binuclear cluster domain family protein [Aspergillus niger]|uniref:Fungal Zn(2)-Cys(6) binuclear cluster domain family protein n=1 Tax=Aspergillus niger TaxID=5061 RepID=A0A505IJP1_ASPNG|nr:Fungal Zn(2)-Cys(6) binuclear cluster domain family protein [Aspergillus niger]